ncbi:MAG: LysM peptidoglycan-binding domain-containing protein [Chthoniobacterales bacterium]
MFSTAARFLLISGLLGLVTMSVSARPGSGKSAASMKVEPGLEKAVKWKWTVEPSDIKNWGLELPYVAPIPVAVNPAAIPTAVTPTALSAASNSTNTYEVKRGDALVLIGKKFHVTVTQLKEFNGLSDSKIRAGQILKIPNAIEIQALTPAPQPAAPVSPGAAKTTKSHGQKPGVENEAETEAVRLQVFLDREQFSSGPITGKPDPAILSQMVMLYQGAHEDAKNQEALMAKAHAVIPDPFTRYTLKEDDFRFIELPRAEKVDSSKPAPAAKGKHSVKSTAPAHDFRPAALTYEQRISSQMLAYRTPWAFVAERFHCDVAYLRLLNSKLPARPVVGSEFRVPAVVPFEIEKAFDGPLQPQADPAHPVTAAVVGLSRLEISRDGKLIAVMPLAPARPGLRGTGYWRILDAIPRPRLATQQEPREKKVPPKTSPFYINPNPLPVHVESGPVLSAKQYLPAGPRNPVGILWINLEKSDSEEPLPYGLHGTNAPDRMNKEVGIGGFQLTNWDILRAVHQLPMGTMLEWKP